MFVALSWMEFYFIFMFLSINNSVLQGTSLRWHMDVSWNGPSPDNDQLNDPELFTLPFLACFFTWKMKGLEQIHVFQMPVMFTQKFTKNTNSWTSRSTRSKTFIFFFFFLFFLPCRTSCRILAPRPGIEPRPLPVKALSPNHWTAREFPETCIFNSLWIILLYSWTRYCSSSFHC